MQTRRDHIQAYRFSAGRLVHAVTAGDPGTGELPLRRGNLGVVLGLVIALMLSGGAVVYGLISPVADTSWKSQGSIIVEKETGTRYVLLDGVLRPTANYVSARLAGSSKQTVHMVAHSALAAVPIGSQIGIAGAPDSLPGPSALLSGAWSLCLRSAATGDTVLDLAPRGHTVAVPTQRPILVVAVPASASAPASTPVSALASTSGAVGAANAASPAAAPAEIVSGEYVLWDAKKYPVPNTSVLASLGLGNQDPVSASTVWLGLFGTGDPLSPAQIPSAGHPGTPVAGHKDKVGQVFQTTAGGVAQFYVLLSDGLAPITHTEAALLATVPSYGQPVVVDPSDITGVPVSADQSLLRRLPELISAKAFALEGGTRLCAYQATAGSSAGPVLVTEADRYFPDNMPDTTAALVPAGKGLIAESTSVSPLSGAPAVFLINDAGERFIIEGSDTLQALGYTGVAGHVLPDAVLGLVPPGPPLSVTAARKAVSWSAG